MNKEKKLSSKVEDKLFPPLIDPEGELKHNHFVDNMMTGSELQKSYDRVTLTEDAFIEKWGEDYSGNRVTQNLGEDDLPF